MNSAHRASLFSVSPQLTGFHATLTFSHKQLTNYQLILKSTRVLLIMLLAWSSAMPIAMPIAMASATLYAFAPLHSSSVDAGDTAIKEHDSQTSTFTRNDYASSDRSRQGIVEIFPAINATFSGDRLTFPQRSGDPIEVVLTSNRKLDGGGRQWTGYVNQMKASSSVIITLGTRGLYARLTIDDRVFAIEPTIDGRHWLIDEAQAGFVHREIEYDTQVAPEASSETFDRAHSARQPAPARKSRIKLLVLYSTGFASRHADPRARIEQLLAIANQTLKNSRVNAAIDAVHYQAVAHPDTDLSNATLNAMSFSEGLFYNLEDLRLKHQADLVTLIRADHPASENCGLAWIPKSQRMTATSHRYGYSLAHIRNPVEAGCPDWVVAHELGHNFGADHDRETGCEGLLPYACGFRNLPLFKTIMAYGPYDANVNKFSSPSLDCKGQPCGEAATSSTPADNAKMLRTMAPVIASYAPGTIKVLRPTLNEQLAAGTTFKVTWSNIGVVGRRFDIELLRRTGEQVALLHQNYRAEKRLNVVCLGTDCGSWVNQQDNTNGQDDYCSGPDCRAFISYSARVTLPETLSDYDDYVLRVVSSTTSTVQAQSKAFSVQQNRLTIFPARELAVDENGLSDRFKISLEKRPTADVRINLSSSDPSEGVVKPAYVVFTPRNWSTARTVAVTGVDDQQADGNINFVVTTSALISDDPAYSGINPKDIPVVNFDREPDSDGDGVPDQLDAFPTDPSEWADNDKDGAGDNVDPDDDNDGMPDSYETSFGLNPLNAADRRNDPDKDNLTNWQEFQLGSDPRIADADQDKDGIPDIADSAPSDPSNSGQRRSLTSGKVWRGRYGNGYGNDRYYSTILFTFENKGDDVLFSLQGFDIDTTDELRVLFNDQILGYVPVGPNNAVTDTAYFHIDISNQRTGNNELRITQKQPGHAWGITNIELTRINQAVTSLEFNNVSKIKHGFRTPVDIESVIDARYEFTAPYTNRPLMLTLDSFSVDFAGQIGAYLNDQYLGYLVPAGRRTLDTQAIRSQFILPSLWLRSSNQIRFVQSQPGQAWGVTNLKVSPVIDIVAPAGSSSGVNWPRPRVSWRID